ncbi:MAG TPA: mannitol dehydrogenase family protein [Roseiarcus sp.]|jgi:fructuronate reductase
MRRLDRSSLPDLAPSARRPRYDRENLEIGIAHIGVGAFHRCHQAEFIDDMLEARFGRWGVLGVNLTAPNLAGLLAPQQCLYSRTLRQDERSETRIIGALRQVIDVNDKASAEAAVAALGGSQISVVTMTVTEKGYCLTPSTGALDFDNPALRADLDGGFPPRTLLGLLALSLERRRRMDGKPLTLISCDNIPSNGARLGAAMLAFAALRSAELTRWIMDRVTFPSTMVDRIVPATMPDDIDEIASALGLRDPAAVIGEPFRQWVIEDRFAGERPPLDLAGAEFVADAKPYEQIKMRVLNAAQSTLAHQGALVGHAFTYQAAADPTLAALTRRMLERETSTTLPRVVGMEVAPYIDQSMARIRNAAIRHRCHQIGTDGSQKIVQRLVDPLRERLAAGQPAGLLALSVASWIAYALSGARRFGARWAPSDPYAEAVIAIGEKSSDWSELARTVLAIAPIFGTDMARPQLIEPIARCLRGLLDGDAGGYLKERLSDA